MHVILYVLDALRADHLHCYGYQRNTSPHIDQIAQDGVLFENCFTSTTWTRPVAASLLSGAYPAVHKTRSRYDMFSIDLVRLPEVLSKVGFHTAAFATMGNIASEIGFERGFDEYHDIFRNPKVMARRSHLNAAREGLLHADETEVALPWAEDIHDFLFPWLEVHKNDNTFNFIWSIETHEPYRAPDPFRVFSQRELKPGEGESDDIRGASAADRQRLIDLYDDGIYYNDHCLGQIVAQLKEKGIYDDTLILIIGDHGDAFHEHGFYAHGNAPYEELIHVPLIIKFPNAEYAGSRVAGLAELIDLFPTICAYANVPAKDLTDTMLQGRNLLPLVRTEAEQVREYVFSDTQSLSILNHYLSVRTSEWKYVRLIRPKRDGRNLFETVRHVIERGILLDILRRPRHFLRSYTASQNEFLFNLVDDPDEQHNCIEQYPEQAATLRAALQAWQTENEQIAEKLSSDPLDYKESESLKQHLEKLGYL